MLPPLNITIDEIDEAIGILLSVLDDINKEK